jgi:DNA-binding HxlR family transcriptional regulator
MDDGPRSRCPINLALEVLGDKWSLLILRDMIFSGKRHFRELMRSQEGISSNILADRVGMLVAEGLPTKADDPAHKQKVIYSLTEKAIELVPVLALLGAWGRKHLPASEELSIRAEVLERGGPPLWDRFMRELRQEHLASSAAKRSAGPALSVRATLQSEYERGVERRRRAAGTGKVRGRRRG